MTKAATKHETKTFSVFDFAKELTEKKTLELKNEETLVIKGFDLSDFMSIVACDSNLKKVGFIQQVFARFGLMLFFEGSMNLKNLNLEDASLSFSAGESKELKITARPQFLRKSIEEIASFLQNLPENGVLGLKPNQDLLIEGFAKKDLMDYYQVCASNKDVQVQQNAQDLLFENACSSLKGKGLNLRVFAANADAINREVNGEFGGLYLKATSQDASKEPVLLMGLIKK